MPNRFPRAFRFPWRSGREIRQDIEDELAFHLEARTADLIATGLTAEAARRQAHAEFGDLDFTRRYCRDLDERTERAVRTRDRLTDWLQDLRLAWRTTRRSPSFALISVLTLVLAIGANTAVFTVARAVLVRPLPYGAPEALVAVYETPRLNPAARVPLSVPNLVDYRAEQHTLTGIAGYLTRSVTWLPAGGDPELLNALSVTSNMFTLLQVQPVLGRGFIDGDDRRGAPPIALLAYDFWQRSLHGDPAIVGRTLTLNDLQYTVLGVMPPGFALGNSTSLWTPLDLSRDLADAAVTRRQHTIQAIGRLRPGTTLAAATAELQEVSRSLETRYPEANTDRIATLIPLHEALAGNLRPAMLLLQAASGLLLLIACVNLANVTLSRTIGRQRELAVRAALGAGRGRLVRQLLTESFILALIGGALGVALAGPATRLLLALQPGVLPALFDVRPDGMVLLFGLLVSIATGVGFGLLPARNAARTDLHGALREGGRGASGGPRAERFRRGLVTAQMGIAVVLVIAAGLLIRSFAELTRMPWGFDPDHVLTAEVRVSGERYDDPVLVNRFYDQVLESIRQAPGVLSVGATMRLPTDGWVSSSLVVEGVTSDPARLPEVGYLLARGEYFSAMKIPLLAGRSFDAHDTPDAPAAVLVNQAAVHAFFPSGDPVGRRIRLGPDPSAPWSVVVGVVGDVREQGLDIPPAPAVYPNHVQNTWWRSLTLVVRTQGDPAAVEPVIRRAVQEADPVLAIRAVRTLDQALGSSLAARRFAMVLVSCFAGVALLLAAVGIYGVLAFSVTSRTREFGVRLALGASPGDVLLLVVRQGMTWAALGIGLGLLGAFAGGHLLAGMLYGVPPADGFTFLLVTALLVSVAAVACLIPATRATRVSPVASMQAD